jgi:hypothetical protein
MAHSLTSRDPASILRSNAGISIFKQVDTPVRQRKPAAQTLNASTAAPHA